jgi:UDP-glucose 4-epimerase
MRVLVVGGAGYIGAHSVRALLAAGHQVVIFDNLVAGHVEAAKRLGVPLVEADLNHPGEVFKALQQNPVDAVMHFAAFANVGESVTQPNKYYQNNLIGTIQLLEAMRQQGIKNIVFSSTCATYGNPTTPTLDETHPQRPINPYGWSKLMVEQILRDYDHAYNIRHVALRYFNASGASADGLLGEEHHPETHLIPICLQVAAGMRDHLVVFGEDYDTLDGTCIRDYIHVEDLADAHVRALDHLAAGGTSEMLNVGTGKGHSVREVIRCSEKVTNLPIKVVKGARREGDPPVLVAAADKVREKLGWKPKYVELEPIVESAWRWFKNGGKYRPATHS